MDNDKLFRAITQRGSRTYFYSSIFFPPAIRTQVFRLYSFVRVADNFVDAIPQQGPQFEEFCSRYHRANKGEVTGDVIIDSFVALMRERNFDPAWVDAFLAAMRLDLTTRSYETLGEVIDYMYGSAEVVGLMMARILGLPEESLHSARMLGRAMQYINFIRDMQEDREFGRTYMPMEDLRHFGLRELSAEVYQEDPAAFSRFLHFQIARFEKWQHEAEKGYCYIPRRLLIPIRTAGEMYRWTGRSLLRDPQQIFSGKLKPSKARIVLAAGYNALRITPSPSKV